MEAIGDDGSLSLDRTRTIAEVETGYTYFREGDVTFAKITPCFENGKGALMQGLREGIGFGTTELIVARPKPSEVLGPLLNWIFRSPNFRKQGEASMYGAGGQKRVPDDFVRDFAWAFPPIDEQAAIAAFLDRETAKIDELIAEQEKLIALLAEKRHATISHAVTRGLNNNVPLKDSGVAWLSEVPVHWEVKKLRYIANVVRGASPRPAGDPRFFASDDEFGVNCPWVTVAEVTKDEDVFLKEVVEYLTPTGVEHSQSFEAGTLIFTNSGATLGVPKILAINCCANDGILAFRNLSDKADIRFVYYFLLTTTERLRTEMKQGGGQPNLNTGIVKEISLALPPHDEQLQVVNFLEAEILKFDSLRAQAERTISLFKERRDALIAAAVTGQFDVRGTVQLVAVESPEALAA
jgi:type I restriction enzyme S subunit